MKLYSTENGILIVLDEIHRISLHRQNIQNGVVNNVIYNIVPGSHHSVRIGQELLRLCCHGVGPSLKLSCTPNGLVRDETRRIHVQLNMPYLRHQFRKYLRHRGTFAVDTPYRPGATTAVSAWRRAIIKLKLSCTQNDPGPVFDGIRRIRVHP